MSNPWRLQYEDAYCHILLWGNEWRSIFYNDQDRRIFLETLGEAGERFGTSVYAFVLIKLLPPASNRWRQSIKDHAVVGGHLHQEIQQPTWSFRSFFSKSFQKHHRGNRCILDDAFLLHSPQSFEGRHRLPVYWEVIR